MAKLRKLQYRGIFFLRSPFQPDRNKLTLHLLMERAGIPTPATEILHVHLRDKLDISQFRFPRVVKHINKWAGKSVYLVQSVNELNQALDDIFSDSSYALIQEPVEPLGKDARVYMVGQQPIVLFDREARDGDFRCNFQNGAKWGIGELLESELKVMQNIMLNTGFSYAGIDFARTETGPKIFEIEKGPGLYINQICSDVSVNLSQNIVEWALRQMKHRNPGKYDHL